MADISRALSVARKTRSTGGSSTYDDMGAFIAQLRQEMAARGKSDIPPIMKPGGLQGQQAQSTFVPRSLQAPTPIGPNGGRATDQVSDLGKLTNNAPQWAKDWFADKPATGVQTPPTNGSGVGDTKRLPASPTASIPASTAANTDVIEGIKSKIGAFESQNNYAALGKVIKHGDSTDRAYGKYQVMGSNVGPWTKEAIGTELTPDQFLKDPKAQEAVASYKMGQLYQQYGNPQDVASVWFSGKPAAQSSKLADANGTTGADYIAKTVGAAPAQPAPLSGKVGDWRANAAAVGITPDQMNTMTAAEQQQFMDPFKGTNTATGPVPGAQGALDATTNNYKQDVPQPQPGPQASAQPVAKPDLAQLWPNTPAVKDGYASPASLYDDTGAQNAARGGRIGYASGGGSGGAVPPAAPAPAPAPDPASVQGQAPSQPISMTRGWTAQMASPVSMIRGWPTGGDGSSMSAGANPSPTITPALSPISGVSGTSGISTGQPSSALGFAPAESTNSASPYGTLGPVNSSVTDSGSIGVNSTSPYGTIGAVNPSVSDAFGINNGSPYGTIGAVNSSATNMGTMGVTANGREVNPSVANSGKLTNSVPDVSPEMSVAQTAAYGNIGAVNSSVSAPTEAAYGVSASPATMSNNYGISNTPSVSAMSPDSSISPANYGASASTGNFGIGETGAVSGPDGAPVGGVGDGSGDGGGWKKGGYVLGPRRKNGGYIDRALAKAFAEGGNAAETAVREAKGVRRTRAGGGNIVSKALEAANQYNPNLTRQALDATRRVS